MGKLERERNVTNFSVVQSVGRMSISRIQVLGVTGHEFLSPSEPEIFFISFVVAICFSKKFSKAHIGVFQGVQAV